MYVKHFYWVAILDEQDLPRCASNTHEGFPFGKLRLLFFFGMAADIKKDDTRSGQIKRAGVAYSRRERYAVRCIPARDKLAAARGISESDLAKDLPVLIVLHTING